MRFLIHVFSILQLDGFIARPDGGLDWMDKCNATLDFDPMGDEMGFMSFLASVDALVMGRFFSFEKP